MLENITLDNIFSKISKWFTKDRKITFIVTFIIVKLPMPAADIRISGARSRMDMLPDYFEAAATSKICLSGTRGSA